MPTVQPPCFGRSTFCPGLIGPPGAARHRTESLPRGPVATDSGRRGRSAIRAGGLNRLAILCLAAAVVLSACSSKTDPNASGEAQGGTSGFGAGGGFAGRAAAGSQEDLTQSAGDRIFFETDQSVVTPDAQATLGRQAQWLQQNARVSVWIAGNCDERGTEEYNLALGQRRASAARDYLVSRGVAAGRIATISYGKTRPVDPASTEDGWARNRNAITSVR